MRYSTESLRPGRATGDYRRCRRFNRRCRSEIPRRRVLNSQDDVRGVAPYRGNHADSPLSVRRTVDLENLEFYGWVGQGRSFATARVTMRDALVRSRPGAVSRHTARNRRQSVDILGSPQPFARTIGNGAIRRQGSHFSGLHESLSFRCRCRGCLRTSVGDARGRVETRLGRDAVVRHVVPWNYLSTGEGRSPVQTEALACSARFGRLQRLLRD